MAPAAETAIETAIETAAEPARPRRTRAKATQPAQAPAAPEQAPQAPPAARRSPARRGKPAAAQPSPEQAMPIYQIHFQPSQRQHLDPAFIPLDNSDHDNPLHEFAVFERLAAEEGTRLAPLWGALSWRFSAKTGLSGQALLHAIGEHPGHDLYYCNPFPEHEALYVNGWHQGAPSHPAFLELCTAVFKAAGLDPREIHAVQSSRSFSACNYFVASPAFWAAYLPWVRGVLDRARARLPKPMLRLLDSRLSDPKNQHSGASYWPFIVERLLPLFLRSAGQTLKTHKLTLPVPESRLNVHLQRLREMKDVAHRTRSRWLYSCWLNYRNLYLLQTGGSDWCKRYLSALSPAEPEFR